jgi:hypothetical protein
MKQQDVKRMNRLLEEVEAFLNERGATLLNNPIYTDGNDYGIASAGVRIDLIERVNNAS